jgi:hypothetical protein
MQKHGKQHPKLINSEKSWELKMTVLWDVGEVKSMKD